MKYLFINDLNQRVWRRFAECNNKPRVTFGGGCLWCGWYKFGTSSMKVMSSTLWKIYVYCVIYTAVNNGTLQ